MNNKKKGLFILFTILLGFSFATFAQTKSSKRGVAFNNLTEQELELLSPGVSWAYNWGASVNNVANLGNNGIDYIPMIWGSNNISNSITTARNYLTAHPEIKYILGFNEPNLSDQANMSPQFAAQLWTTYLQPLAQEFNLKIVGPAVNYSATYDPFQWYDDFFAACPDCQVDFVAVHLYMTSASSIQSNLAQFKKWGKPIWFTEFCVLDNTTTVSAQSQFMVQTLDYLETDPDIFRYSWFKADGGSSSWSLFDNTGALTPIGEIYTHMSSYDSTYYFTTDQQIPATQYIRMNRANMEKTTDESGYIDLYGMTPLSWMDYNVDIPEDGEYNIFFRSCPSFATTNSTAFVSVNGVTIATMPFVNQGLNNWDTQSCTGAFSKGKQTIRVGFTQGGLKLNWFAITQSSTAPTGIESAATDDVKAYPNPVSDILNLQVPANTQVTLYSICGNSVYSGKSPNAINMSAFPQGIYILDMRFENGGRKVEKIIKEK